MSEALTGRMTALHLTVTDLAAKAHVDPTTIRNIITCRRWPREHTRHAIEAALGWPEDELAAHLNIECDLDAVTTDELLAELRRRCRT